jgi:hypothetical protein
MQLADSAQDAVVPGMWLVMVTARPAGPWPTSVTATPRCIRTPLRVSTFVA